MVMVGTCPVEVERRLRAGELMCPCGGGLSPWGHARQRVVRGVGVLRPRRARCGRCLVTHVLFPVTVLLRRADAVAVPGAGAFTSKSRALTVIENGTTSRIISSSVRRMTFRSMPGAMLACGGAP